jgi:hypothetical protein
MAENFIHKKIGPFSGGVWIVVVGGGIGLAFLIKRGMGGGSAPAQSPILVENIPQRTSGGVTSWNDPAIPGKEEPKTIPSPVVPKPVPIPAKPTLPLPTPVPYIPPRGGDQGPTKPLPTPTPFPKGPIKPIPTPQKPTVPIPGGGDGTCTGVTYVPPDYTAKMNGPTGKFNERAIKISWAVQNLGTGPQGIYALTQWISSPIVWPVVNATRKTRGLRPLSENEFRSLINDLNGIIVTLGGKENKLTNAQIMSIWSKYNTPFLCANAPIRRDSRSVRRTGEL